MTTIRVIESEQRTIRPIRLPGERSARERMIRQPEAAFLARVVAASGPMVKIAPSAKHTRHLEVRVDGAWRRCRVLGEDHRGIAVELIDSGKTENSHGTDS